MISTCKMIKNLGIGLMLSVGLMISVRVVAAPAPTDFTFTVSNPNIVAPAGTAVVFDGTVTVTGPTVPLFGSVFGDYFGPDTTSVDLDPAFITYYTTSSVLSYTGAIYDVTIAPGLADGTSVTLPGDCFLSLNDNSGSISHPVSIVVQNAATTPEPSSIAVFALGGLALLGCGIRTRKMNAARN